jgi:hypothetical protein
VWKKQEVFNTNKPTELQTDNVWSFFALQKFPLRVIPIKQKKAINSSKNA